MLAPVRCPFVPLLIVLSQDQSSTHKGHLHVHGTPDPVTERWIRAKARRGIDASSVGSRCCWLAQFPTGQERGGSRGRALSPVIGLLGVAGLAHRHLRLGPGRAAMRIGSGAIHAPTCDATVARG